MEEQISFKAQELLEAFKRAETKWTSEVKQKEEFIRRRDQTIVGQIDAINAMTKETEDLTKRIKQYEEEVNALTKKYNIETTENHKLLQEKNLAFSHLAEVQKERDMWKTKYIDLKTLWRDECKRRVDTLCEDEMDERPTKLSRKAAASRS